MVLVPRQRMPNANSTATFPLSFRIARSMRTRASVDRFDPNRRTQAPWTNHERTCGWSMLHNQFTTIVPDGPDWKREGSGSIFSFPSETSPFQKETLEGRHVAVSCRGTRSNSKQDGDDGESTRFRARVRFLCVQRKDQQGPAQSFESSEGVERHGWRACDAHGALEARRKSRTGFRTLHGMTAVLGACCAPEARHQAQVGR